MRPRILISTTLLLLAACDGEPADLRVGDVRFTSEDLLGVTEENERILAGITAVGLALTRDEVERLGAPLLERRRDEALVERLAAEVVVQAAGADEEALRAHYLTNPEHELTVRHIVFLSERGQDEALRDEARRKAREALERVRAGEPFAELAAELSEEPGADRRGGRLEPGRRGSWVPEFWEAASVLEEGEHTGVVETRYGFHVIELEERTLVPFREARPRVVARVAELVGDDGAWRDWADSAVSAGLTVDAGVVERWREGAAPDSVAVAEWEGGRWTVGELERRVATLDARDADAARRAPERALDVARAGARLAFLAHLAGGRGLEPLPGEVDAVLEDWTETVNRWGAALGFLGGRSGSVTDVRARALEGFASGAQGARIARQEIGRRLPLLLRAYPVEGLEERDVETAPSSGA